MRPPLQLLFALTLALASATALARDFAKGDLFIAGPWARVTHSATAPGVVFFEVENRGKADDRLLSVSGEIAKAVEIHSMVEDEEGVVSMRLVTDGVVVPAGGALSLESGGYHLMLIGLEAPLADGAVFPLRLTFEKAGDIDVEVKVENRAAGEREHKH